jgi:hypothetical protein
MTRMAFVIALAAVVGPTGCGDDVPPVPTRFTDELHCDIGNAECQNRIYDSVAAMLGMDGIERPAIRTISVDQHAEEVRSGLDLEDLTGEDATTRGLRLMGFIPAASESLTETQVEYWINAIAAYYSRRSRSITVIDRDYEDIDGQAILAHEFTHAIQDIQFNLDEVSADADTEDGVMGVRSVIEGDATHTSMAWVYEKLGYLPEDSASSFPYAYGFDFMTAVTLSGGLSGRAAAFESPPSTAVEVMVGFGAELSVLDFPATAHPSPIEGYAIEVENRFGAWYVYGLLRRGGMSDPEAWLTALSWVGDELAIYDDGSEVVAAWRVRFDDSVNASIVRDQVNADNRDVASSAVLYEDDVFVFAAESDETLLAWAAQPLDWMTASLVPKSERRRGGAVSVGSCMQSRHFSLPNPPPLLH